MIANSQSYIDALYLAFKYVAIAVEDLALIFLRRQIQSYVPPPRLLHRVQGLGIFASQDHELATCQPLDDDYVEWEPAGKE